MSSNPGDAGTDDLTRITGIGTKIARRLNMVGIQTYAELASRSADDIMTLLPDVTGLPLARVDGWRDEARKLVAAQASPGSSAATRSNDQRYESFLVRVLLNEDGSIRRTTVRHVGTGAEGQWPGLGRDALSDFIEARISSPAPPVPGVRPHAEAPEAAATPAAVAPVPGTTQPGTTQPGTAPAPVHGEPAGATFAPFASSAVLSVERTTLRASEPFTMTMAVDLTGSPIGADRLRYSAVIVAKPLDGKSTRTVAQTEGLFPTTTPTISIDAAGLPPGAYRLDGAVSFSEPGSGHALGLAAIAEGFLVYVPSA